MDGSQIFLTVSMTAMFSFALGFGLGENYTEDYYQRLIIQHYNATYCDGKFSLEKCDDQ